MRLINLRDLLQRNTNSDSFLFKQSMLLNATIALIAGAGIALISNWVSGFSFVSSPLKTFDDDKSKLLSYVQDGKNSTIAIFAVVVALVLALIFASISSEDYRRKSSLKSEPLKIKAYWWLLRVTVILSIGGASYALYLVIIAIANGVLVAEIIVILGIGVLNIILGSTVAKGFLAGALEVEDTKEFLKKLRGARKELIRKREKYRRAGYIDGLYGRIAAAGCLLGATTIIMPIIHGSGGFEQVFQSTIWRLSLIFIWMVISVFNFYLFMQFSMLKWYIMILVSGWWLICIMVFLWRISETVPGYDGNLQWVYFDFIYTTVAGVIAPAVISCWYWNYTLRGIALKFTDIQKTIKTTMLHLARLEG